MADAATADLRALAQDLTAASTGGSFKAAQQVIRATAEQVKAQAQALAPVKTGRLRDSITVHYVGPLSATIGPSAPYGVYQEFGTGSRGEFPGTSYVIQPKRPGGVLVFTVNGRRVYTRKVVHPGVRPRPFMRPALKAVLGDQLAAKLADAGALLITKGPNA